MLLKDNITSVYKKAPKSLESAINSEAKYIAENLKLNDQFECIAKTTAYITLKAHKQYFRSNRT